MRESLRQSLQTLQKEPNANFITAYLQEMTVEDVKHELKLNKLVTLTRCIN